MAMAAQTFYSAFFVRALCLTALLARCAEGVDGAVIATAASATGDPGRRLQTATPTLTAPYSNSIQFSYTGAAQTYVVPAGTYTLQIDACGQAGGVFDGGGTVVAAGFIQSLIPVTPGQTLYVMVGGGGGLERRGVRDVWCWGRGDGHSHIDG